MESPPGAVAIPVLNPDGSSTAIAIAVPKLHGGISIPIIPLVNMDGHPAIAIAMPNLDGEGYEIQRHPKGIQVIPSSVFAPDQLARAATGGDEACGSDVDAVVESM